MSDRPYAYSSTVGRLDAWGTEWFACDPYPTWFRWEDGKLILPGSRHIWADESRKGAPAVTPKIAATFDPSEHNGMMLYGKRWEPVFLYAADPFCKHELNQWIYSGINCKHCRGWYCI